MLPDLLSSSGAFCAIVTGCWWSRGFLQYHGPESREDEDKTRRYRECRCWNLEQQTTCWKTFSRLFVAETEHLCCTKCDYITESGVTVTEKRVPKARKTLDRIESLEIIAVCSEVFSPIQMIIPTNWVSPFFVIFGACMILATITCCLFHLRKNRNQKKEIKDWVNAVKHGRVVYHPLLHWIKNNSDLSIKTKEYSSDNEECKKRKIWKAQNMLPPRYKKKSRNSGAFNHKAGYFNNPQIGKKSFPKSSVDVASGEASWIHSQPNKEKNKYFSFPNTAKPLKKVLPTSPSLDESFANIYEYEMKLDEKQPDVVSSKKRESLGSPVNQKN